MDSSTIADLAAMVGVGARSVAQRWTSLIAVRPTGSKAPLFSVAPWSALALSFSELGEALDTDQPLYVFQIRGADTDADPHETVKVTAAHYIAEMCDVQPVGPYAIGGHCSGSIVALEMARQLDTSGEHLISLLLVDPRPPAVAGSPSGIGTRIAKRARYYWQQRRLLPALRWQIGESRRMARPMLSGGTGVHRLHRARRTQSLAQARYVKQPFMGAAVLIHTAASNDLGRQDFCARWAWLVAGTLRHDIVPGTHATVLQQSFVTRLASAIDAALETNGACDAPTTESSVSRAGVPPEGAGPSPT